MYEAGYGNKRYAFDFSTNRWRELTSNNKMSIYASKEAAAALGKPPKSAYPSSRRPASNNTIPPKKTFAASMQDNTLSNISMGERENRRSTQGKKAFRRLRHMYDPEKPRSELMTDLFGSWFSRKKDSRSAKGSGGFSSYNNSLDRVDKNISKLVKVNENMLRELRLLSRKATGASATTDKTGAEDGGGGGGILGTLGSLLGLAGGASGIIKMIWPILKKSIGRFAKAIATKIPLVGPIILGAFGLYDAVDEYMKTGEWDSAVGTFFESIADGLTFGFASSTLGEGTIKTFVKDIIKKTTEIFEDLIDIISDTFDDMIKSISDTFEDVVDKITDFFEDYVMTPLFELPKQIINTVSKQVAGVLEFLSNIKIGGQEIDFAKMLPKGAAELLGIGTYKLPEIRPFSNLGDIAAGMRQGISERESAIDDRRAAIAEQRSVRDAAKETSRMERDYETTASRTGRDATKAEQRAPTATPSGGLDVKKLEGFRSNVYNDPAGIPTIGYGHKLTAEELKSGVITLPDGTKINWKTDGLTEAQASALLERDKKSHDEAAAKKLQGYGIDMGTLSPNVREALNDLAYNAGAGIFDKSPKLIEALKANDPEAIARELRTTGRTSGGQILPGLESRANQRADLVLDAAGRSTGGVLMAASSAAMPSYGANAPVVTNVVNNNISNGNQQGNIQIASARNDDSSMRRMSDQTILSGVI